MAQSATDEAEQCFLDSLRLARDHRALSFELRAGMSLARLWTASGRSDRALEFLTSINSRFSEGFQTFDLVSAATLLDELGSRTSSDSPPWSRERLIARLYLKRNLRPEPRSVVLRRDPQQAQKAAAHGFLRTQPATLRDPFDRQA